MLAGLTGGNLLRSYGASMLNGYLPARQYHYERGEKDENGAAAF